MMFLAVFYGQEKFTDNAFTQESGSWTDFWAGVQARTFCFPITASRGGSDNAAVNAALPDGQSVRDYRLQL